MDPKKAAKNEITAKENAIESDLTWGSSRAVEGKQRIVIEATGHTRDVGSLFLYHTWVTFVIVSEHVKKFRLTHNCYETINNHSTGRQHLNCRSGAIPTDFK